MLKKLLDAVNGKKTTVSAVLLLFSAFVDQLIVAKMGITPPAWLQHASDASEWFGMVLGPVGLAHKGVKIYLGGKEPKLEADT